MSSDVEILLKCLELEWQDHFQTRIQTWRTLEIVAAIAVGLVGIDWQIGNRFATSAAALLLIAAAGFGVLITRRHRKVEREKFENIICGSVGRSDHLDADVVYLHAWSTRVWAL
jgi:hypothetical protein